MDRRWSNRRWSLVPSRLRSRSAQSARRRASACCLEPLEARCLLAIDVAVVGGTNDDSGFAAIVSQLNNDTYFDFNAALVTPSQVDSAAELNAYDVVIIGNNGLAGGDPFDNAAFTGALRSWAQGGGGLVATGWTIYGAGIGSGASIADIDAIVPVNTAGFHHNGPVGAPLTPNGVAHPVTSGVSSFTLNGGDYIEYPASSPPVDPGATVLATVNEQPAVVVGAVGQGRSVYLGPIYSASSGHYNNSELRTGSPDRLLEQAVAWAVNPDATPPSVVGTSPANSGTLNAASFSSMTVTFSEAVTAATAQDPANYGLEGPNGAVPITSATLGGGGTVVTLTFPAESSTGAYQLYVGNIADPSGNTMPVLGGYGAPVYYRAGGDDTYLWSSTVGDFNNDDRPDLIAWRSGTPVFDRFLGQPGGGFDGGTNLAIAPGGYYVQQLTSADLDGDGNLDLIAAEDNFGVGVYFGHGDGAFDAVRQLYNYGARSVQIADLNGDRRLDVVAGTYQGYLFSFRNDGTRNTSAWQPVVSPGPQIGDFHLADLNADGVLDAVTTYFSTTGYVWLGDPSTRGLFHFAYGFSMGYSSENNALADIDQDGRPDLVTGPYGGNVAYGLGTPAYFGTVQNLNLDSSGAYATNVTTADLDGDGDLDILKGGYGNGTVSVAFNTNPAAHAFSNQSIPVGADYIYQVHAQDLNGDGLPEIIGTSYYAGGVFVLSRNTGTLVSTFNLVTNRPPAAQDDAATVLEDSGANAIAVLANDSDPDGDPLTVTAVTQGAHGTVTITGGGTGLTYTPAPDDFGTDHFSYTIADNHGGTATASVTVMVDPVNDAPSFTPGDPVVVLEDSGAYEAPWAANIAAGPANEAGQLVDFEVLGNSNPALFAVAPTLSPAGVLSFIPAADANGTAILTVRLRDNGGNAHGGSDASGVANLAITIQAVNDRPIANDDSATTDEDQPVVIPVLANDRPGPATALDESGQGLVITHLNGQPVNPGASVPTAQGTVTLNADGTVTYAPGPDSNGSDGFSYTVRDDGDPPESASASGFVTINPVNDAPVLVTTAVALATINEDDVANGGTSIAGILSSMVIIDVDAGAVRGLAVAGVDDAHGAWQFSTDGGASWTAFGSVADTAARLLADDPADRIRFVPAPNFFGPASFTFRAWDQTTGNDGGTADVSVHGGITASSAATGTAAIAVQAVNDAPVAEADPGYTTDEDSPLMVVPAHGVLGNDSDIDQDLLTTRLIAGPAAGALVLDADGAFTFDPRGAFDDLAVGQSRQVSFTYVANDGTADSNPATVTITVTGVNDAPGPKKVARKPVTSEDTSLDVDITGLDPDGDPLTYLILSGPSHGTLSGTAPELIYTPAPDYFGTDELTYEVDDPYGGTFMRTVTILVSEVNDAPRAADDAFTTDEDTPNSGNVLTNDSDPDNTDGIPGNEDALSVVLVSGPSHGTLVLSPSGTFDYAPDLNDFGSDSFTYKVVDSDGAESGVATVAITIHEVNDVPAVSADSGNVTVDEGQVATSAGSFADVDLSDVVTISASVGTVTRSGTNSGSWSWSFATSDGPVESQTVTITAADGRGGVATTSFALQVNNLAPTANGDNATTNEDTPVTIAVLANDTDPAGAHDPLTVAAVTQGAHGSVVVNPDGTVTYSPAANDSGADSFTYTVSDGDGGTATTTVTVTVVAVADEPTVTASSPGGEEGSPIPIIITPALVDGDGSESLMPIRIRGVPIGASFNHGTRLPDQFNSLDVWQLDLGDLAGLTLTVPDGPADIALTVTAFARESSNLSTAESSQDVAVHVANVAPTAILNAPAFGNEGGPITLSLTNPGDPSSADTAAGFTYAFDTGSGYGAFGASGSATFTPANEGMSVVKAMIRDQDGGTTEYVATVTVLNMAPAVGPITAPTDPRAVGSTVTASAGFTDPGALDAHTAVWAWGDGSTSTGVVVEANGAGTVTGNHVYTAAGVYTVTLTVADKDGGSSQSVYQYVVLYDASAGFVTGGGWITSPPGASAADPSLTGKATFGFVSQYKKGANVPTGNTEFQFQLANLNFRSTGYDWLVVAGARGQYKGSGTINGTGDYAFMLTAVDGQTNGGGGTDKFRIKIWNKATGAVVYDNQTGGTDTADPTTALGGGSIVIHSGGNALQAAGGPAVGGSNSAPLTPQALGPLVDEAIARWQAAGASGAQLAALGRVAIRIDDLPGADLALASDGIIWLDRDAAGYGWFVDRTPADNREFGRTVAPAARGRMDLLTVLDHELGHLLGHDHEDAGVMAETLRPGVRELPVATPRRHDAQPARVVSPRETMPRALRDDQRLTLLAGAVIQSRARRRALLTSWAHSCGHRRNSVSPEA